MSDYLLLAIGIAGLVTSTIYAVLAGFAAVRFALRRRRRPAPRFYPPVSLLKPLHGWEPELEEHLETFFLQNYPQFELLFCVRNAQDQALAVARRVAARYPEIPCKFLVSGEPPCANAKVWSLQCMSDAARHEIFIVSDSDVSVTPQYLREVAAPFADAGVGLVTCLYRGVAEDGEAGGGTLWSRLESSAMSVEMPSGVLVAEMLEGMKFALGPTMAVRRACVEELGGFDVLGSYHADDFALGNLVAGGSKVLLSTYIVEHHILNTSFRQSMLHNIRWMRSTRFSRPKGHLGTVLTFSMPFALLGAGAALGCHRPVSAVALLVWGLATRVQMALLTGGLAVRDRRVARNVLLYPVRDLFAFLCWTGSYLGNSVRWRGEVFQVLGHRLMRSELKPELKPEPEPERLLREPLNNSFIRSVSD